MLLMFFKLQFKKKKKDLNLWAGNHIRLDYLMLTKKDIKTTKNAVFEKCQINST